MSTQQIFLGLVTTVLVFGAYFIGQNPVQRQPGRWREFFRGLTSSLTWRGFAWSVAVPAFWLLLYYSFMAHVWFSLGRWPKFGEALNSRWLTFHDEATRYLFGALVASLYAVAVVLLVCLAFRRWRHVSVYALSYSAAVGLASCGFVLAPHAFLNWLFD